VVKNIVFLYSLATAWLELVGIVNDSFPIMPFIVGRLGDLRRHSLVLLACGLRNGDCAPCAHFKRSVKNEVGQEESCSFVRPRGRLWLVIHTIILGYANLSFRTL
jgi:hypothetical protein